MDSLGVGHFPWTFPPGRSLGHFPRPDVFPRFFADPDISPYAAVCTYVSIVYICDGCDTYFKSELRKNGWRWTWTNCM